MVLLVNWKSIKTLKLQKLQTFAVKQIDTTANDKYPEKLFFDVNGDGQIGSFNYKFECAYEGGKSPGAGVLAAPATAGGGRRENQAFLIYLDGIYHLSKKTSPLSGVGLSFGIGSGDDDPKDKKQKNFENLFTDETGFHYNFLFSDDIHGYTGRGVDLVRGSGFANITFLKPSLRAAPISNLNILASYTFLRATKAQPEGTGPLGPGIGPLRFGPASGDKTKDVGWEVDLFIEYEWIKQVKAFFYSGLFSPGKIYGSKVDKAFKVEVGMEYNLK